VLAAQRPASPATGAHRGLCRSPRLAELGSLSGVETLGIARKNAKTAAQIKQPLDLHMNPQVAECVFEVSSDTATNPASLYNLKAGIVSSKNACICFT